MPDAVLHLVKLCVGAAGVEDLRAWQQARMAATGAAPRHVTRQRPRKAEEVLGGSLYWVFQGRILARQKITALQETRREDGAEACAIVLDPLIVLTQAAPRRPFQGWRYLKPEDAPADLSAQGPESEDLPPDLQQALNELGVA